MRWIIILLITIACEEMEISKSNPIHFVTSSDSLYSNQDIGGVENACFCEILNCNDQVTLQFQHTTGETLTLNVYSSAGVLSSTNIPEIATGIYQVTLLINGDMCDNKISMFVTDSGGETQFLLNSGFTSDIASWTATDWVWEAGAATYEFGANDTTAEVSQTFSSKAAGYYRLKFDFDISDFSPDSPHTADYQVIFYNGATEVHSVDFLSSNIPPALATSYNEVIFVPSAFTEVKYYINFTSSIPVKGPASNVPLDALSNWVDLGADWTISATPTTSLTENQSASDLRSPYSTITEAVYGNTRTLTVDFDVNPEAAGSPSRAELVFGSFNNLTNYTLKVFNGYGSVTTGANPYIIIDESTDGLGVYSDGLASVTTTEIDAATYGNVKEVELDFTPDGTDGLVTIKVSLYNNGSLVQSDTHQIDGSGSTLDTHAFTFNTASTFDQIVIQIQKDTLGVFSSNRITMNAVRLYHYETWAYARLEAELRNGVSPITGGTDDYYQANSSGNHVAVFNYVINGDQDNVALMASNGPGGLDCGITINSVTLTSEFTNPKILLDFLELYSTSTIAESECINVQTSHDPSVQITYSNNSNFDGVDYGASPAPEFTIRVPSQFWKEKFPQVTESYAKSDGTFTRVYNERLSKKLLQIGHVPNYMHDKLTRILMHDNITIDGDSWIVKEDEYEHENLNRYSLSKAQIWLTKKDEILKNIL